MPYIHDISELDQLGKDPDAIRKEIAAMRKKYPTMKIARVLRKVGEKFKIELVLEPSDKEKAMRENLNSARAVKLQKEKDEKKPGGGLILPS